MKLKLIKDSEVVVDKDALDLMSKIAVDGENLHLAIERGEASYYMHEYFEQGIFWVKVKFESLEFPVKIFDSPDHEYNRVCAEELVELLNQNNEKED